MIPVVMYRRQENEKHQLAVPQSLAQDVIKQNHDPKYVAYPGTKWTYVLIYLLSVADYAKGYKINKKVRYL